MADRRSLIPPATLPLADFGLAHLALRDDGTAALEMQLGFTQSRTYSIGTTGQALGEEFAGAHPVQHEASAPAASAQAPDTAGAPPREAVTYSHL